MSDDLYIHLHADQGYGIVIKIPSFLEETLMTSITQFFRTYGYIMMLYNQQKDGYYSHFDGCIGNTCFQVFSSDTIFKYSKCILYEDIFDGEVNETETNEIINTVFSNWNVVKNVDDILA